MKMTLSPLQNPDGTWSLVGTGKVDLFYTMPDGSPLTEEAKEMICQCGPGLAKKRYGIKAVRYETEAAALEAAQTL